MKIIAACGNDCSKCPRYNAPGFEKSPDQLHQTAVLWQKIGYRDSVVSNEEISCSGCKGANRCRYSIVGCVEEKGIANCGECSCFPCERFRECLKVTASFEPACRRVCTEEEYKIINKAFFEKEINLKDRERE